MGREKLIRRGEVTTSTVSNKKVVGGRNNSAKNFNHSGDSKFKDWGTRDTPQRL